MADTLGTRAQVTLSLDDLDSLRQEVFAARVRTEKLMREVETAKAGDPNGLIPDLCQTIRAAIKVVQFAVGNLDPSTVCGWPHQDLVQFLDGIVKMPVPDEDSSIRIGMQEMARDMQHFARTAAQYEEYRKQRVAIAVPASASDFGPKTIESQAAHEQRREVEEAQKNDE
jgi:hypothetical protein